MGEVANVNHSSSNMPAPGIDDDGHMLHMERVMFLMPLQAHPSADGRRKEVSTLQYIVCNASPIGTHCRRRIVGPIAAARVRIRLVRWQ